MKTKEEDFVENLFVASTHSYVLIFTNRGRLYWLKVHEIPDVGPQAKGKAVVNLVEAGAPNKGTALAAERDRLGCSWVLYVGDDENDEDAFRIGGNLVAVRIGRKQKSHAGFYLHTQSEIDLLLDALIRVRQQ